MKFRVLAGLTGVLLLGTGCDQQLMPHRAERYAPWEEGLTLGYERPGLPADQRQLDRFQVRVKEARLSPAGRVVVLTTTTLAGAVDVTFLQEDGGVSLGADPGSMTRILPKGFPDRVSQWEDRGVLHQVLGRACVTLPGVSFGSPEPVEGVWVETVPVHALGPRTRTLYLPGVGEAETLVWKDGQWQAVFRLVSRGFTDLPLARAATNQGVVHE